MFCSEGGIFFPPNLKVNIEVDERCQPGSTLDISRIRLKFVWAGSLKLGKDLPRNQGPSQTSRPSTSSVKHISMTFFS